MPPAATDVALLDAAAAGAGDQAAVDAGDTWAALMERASGHLARGVLRAAGRGYGLRVAVLVGKGNNGGDGWGAARRLADAGAQAWVVAPDGVEVELSAEADANRRAWLAGGGAPARAPSDLDAALAWCDVAVDALLGTGVSGAPRGPAGEAAAACNAARDAGVIVVACDVPVGGVGRRRLGARGAVVADLTVTLGGMKRGLVLHPGAAHAGQVVVGDLGPRYRPPASAWRALTPAGAAHPHWHPTTTSGPAGWCWAWPARPAPAARRPCAAAVRWRWGPAWSPSRCPHRCAARSRPRTRR
jgi:ADP-dependent NAD(P)H-hydrate dehydratase / NAD(P)H-hydrate epimerase